MDAGRAEPAVSAGRGCDDPHPAWLLCENRVRLMHYIAAGDADRSNVIWFDDVVVSTEPIGCAHATRQGTAAE